MGRLRFIWSHVKEWKWRIAAALLGLMVVTIASLLYPWLLKLMVDQFGGKQTSAIDIDELCLLLAAVFLLSTVAGYFQQMEMHRLGFKLRNVLRLNLYDSLLRRSLSFYQTAQVGELSSRSTEDIGRLQQFFSTIIAPAFQNTLFIFGCLALMAELNWQATLIVLGLMALPLPLVLVSSRKIRNLSATSRAEHATANALFEEALVALREVKAYIREKTELMRFGNLLRGASTTEIKAAGMQVRINQAIYFMVSALLLVIFYIGTRPTLFPDWTLGGVVAFYFYAYTMTMAMLSSGKIFLAYQELTGSLSRITELISDRSVCEPEGSIEAELHGSICLRDVTFGYDDQRKVFDRASIEFSHGEWVLVTGASGSGKSTLAGLLMRFYNASSGEILIDNVKAVDWKTRALRDQIGFVGQDPVLLHTTLRDNIGFGSEHSYSEEDISQAVHLSCMEDIISTLPQGLDTIVGERGFTLSGGQKARVAIARAVIKQPSVLVFDEANAMLDAHIERLLWRRLRAAFAENTVIIMSHHTDHIPMPFRHYELHNGRFISMDFEQESTRERVRA